MGIKRICRYVGLGALLWQAAGAAFAGEVTQTYRGITLNARLELAADKTLKDGVVLITHGTLAHNGMEAISYMQQVLKDKGRSSLAINLSLGLDNRHGMYECAVTHRHRHTDAVDEIGAWLDWLARQGAKSVVLLGHSRGANQTAWFAAERAHPAVKAVVLLHSSTWDERQDALDYEKRYKTPLKAALEKAQALAKAGKGATVMTATDFLYCANASVTAESFVSYYAPDPRRETTRLLAGIKVPVLAVVAGNDEVAPEFGPRLKPYVDGKRVQMKLVEGADHFFRDLYMDDAVDAIDAFLSAR